MLNQQKQTMHSGFFFQTLLFSQKWPTVKAKGKFECQNMCKKMKLTLIARHAQESMLEKEKETTSLLWLGKFHFDTLKRLQLNFDFSSEEKVNGIFVLHFNAGLNAKLRHRTVVNKIRFYSGETKLFIRFYVTFHFI